MPASLKPKSGVRMRAPLWAYKPSKLIESIEIVREPKDKGEPKSQTPPEQPDSNPISMLKTLVETIESLIDYGSKAKGTSESTQIEEIDHEQSSSDAERYIELFQKQSTIIKKMMSKLN
jgi:hypothetical protein